MGLIKMRVFKILNIEVKISYLVFFILIISIFFSYFSQLIILILVILIHELAHSWVCIYYNIQITEIRIFIFGGVAKFQGNIEEKPKEEAIIALAGPLSNFILIVLTSLIIPKPEIQNNNIIQFFIITNATIGIFNLIPILPLDGGRIARGLIGNYLGLKRATYIIIRLGYIICLLLFVFSLYMALTYKKEYIFLSYLSVYILISNRKEKERMDFIFTKNLVLKKKSLFNEGIMEVKHIIAIETVDIKSIFNEFTLEEYCIITVTDRIGKVIGSLSESEIIDAIIKYESNISLGELLEFYGII